VRSRGLKSGSVFGCSTAPLARSVRFVDVLVAMTHRRRAAVRARGVPPTDVEDAFDRSASNAIAASHLSGRCAFEP